MQKRPGYPIDGARDDQCLAPVESPFGRFNNGLGVDPHPARNLPWEMFESGRFVKLGSDIAGADRAHPNPPSVQLGMQAAPVRQRVGLGRRIDRRLGHRHQSPDAGHDGDSARALRDHRGYEPLTQLRHSRPEEVGQSIEVGPGRLPSPSRQRGTGVRHHDRGPSTRLDDPGDAVGGRQVGDDMDCRDPELAAELVGHRPQPVAAPGRNDQVVAQAGETSGVAVTDAGRRSGDDRETHARILTDRPRPPTSARHLP